MCTRTTRRCEAAGRHFNRGQRAFFFALGYLGGFVGHWVLFVDDGSRLDCDVAASVRLQRLAGDGAGGGGWRGDAARSLTRPGRAATRERCCAGSGDTAECGEMGPGSAAHRKGAALRPGHESWSVAHRRLNIVIASAAKQSRIPPRPQTGLLRCARNDGARGSIAILQCRLNLQTQPSRPRGAFRPSFASSLHPLDPRGRREGRVPAWHPRSAARKAHAEKPHSSALKFELVTMLRSRELLGAHGMSCSTSTANIALGRASQAGQEAAGDPAAAVGSGSRDAQGCEESRK